MRMVPGCVLAVLALIVVGAGCGGSDGSDLEVTLAAGGRLDNRAAVVTTIGGVSTTHDDVDLPFVEDVTLDGDFDLTVEVTSLDGNDVRCEIAGLEEGRNVPLNPDLGAGDSVEIGGPIRSEDGQHVLCTAAGTVDGNSIDYQSSTEVLE